MLQALKAAFWLRVPVVGLGAMPLNLVALACFGVLGFGNHGFWPLGIGLETIYLTTLATHPRFQRYARGAAALRQAGDVESRWQPLIAQLQPDSRGAVDVLAEQCRRVEALWRAQDTSALLEQNLRALRDLQWLYLKLLIARQHVTGARVESDAAKVRADLSGLERELSNAALSPAARESKQATLAILRKRAEHVDHRQQTVQEIASDLTRIEAQVQLVLDNATLGERPTEIATSLDVASAVLDAGSFGSSASEIAQIDAAYAQAPPREAVRQ
jgi:uncharacterized protein YlaN (UPF0358 family)